MSRKNKNATFNTDQIFLDSVLLVISFFIGNVTHLLMYGHFVDTTQVWVVCLYSLIFTQSMLSFHMYDITVFQYVDRIVQRTLTATFIATASVGLLVFVLKLTYTSRVLVIVFVVCSLITTLSSRLIYRHLIRNNKIISSIRILFIGDDEMQLQFFDYIKKTNMNVIIDSRLGYDAPELHDEKLFEAILIKLNVNEIIIVQNPDNSSHIDTKLLLHVSQDMGITTRLLFDLYDFEDSSAFVSSIGTLPVVTYHTVSFDKIQLFYKFITDIVGASIGIIVFLPICLIAAIAIKVESKGPVLFCQTRVGCNGKKFKMYKFRSMYADAEERKAELQAANKMKDGLMFKIDDDPRITRVGKFIRKTSIDELPQLLNVLKREMSLVGTRPPTIDEVEKYERHHHRRISMMPGITGMWQVSGRSDILDFEEVVKLDKKYIDEWSFMLDIKLIFKTVFAVFARKGAV